MQYAVDVRKMSNDQRIAALKFMGGKVTDSFLSNRVGVIYFEGGSEGPTHSDWTYYSENHRASYPLKRMKFDLVAELEVDPEPEETIVLNGITYKRVY